MSEPTQQQAPWWVQQATLYVAPGALLALVLYLDSQNEQRAIEILGKILEQQIAATQALTEALKMMTAGP